MMGLNLKMATENECCLIDREETGKSPSKLMDERENDFHPISLCGFVSAGSQ